MNLNINHEAHVEAVELGTHKITIENQIGCIVGQVRVDGKLQAKQGPQTVSVRVSDNWRSDTVFVDVVCQ